MSSYPKFMDYNIAVSRGLTNTMYYSVFGHSHNVTTTCNLVWDKGGAYTYLTTAKYVKIASDAAEDTAAGTGAQAVIVQGYDANYAFQYETITTAGVTGVTSTNQFLRVTRVVSEDSGSLGYNNGTISVIADQAGSTFTAAGVPTTTSLILASMETTTNFTMSGLYTIEAGYTGYLTKAFVNCAQDKIVYASLWYRPFGKSFRRIGELHVHRGIMETKFLNPIKLDEKGDIQIKALSSSTGAFVSVACDLLLCKE